MPDHSELIYPRLEILARQSPGKIALRYGSGNLSYSQLVAAIDDMTRRLKGVGIRAGVAFAVLCENNLDVIIAYYAAAYLGAVFVPINPSMSARETAHIVSHSDSRLLLYGEEHREVATEALHDSRRQSLVEFLRGPPPSSGALDDRASTGTRAAPDADFLIIYTSGSTGSPKGVVFDQWAEVAGNASLISMWHIGFEDVTLVALPLGFLYGLSTAAATGIQAGGEVIVLPRFRPGDVLKAIRDNAVTVFHGVPTMFSMMLDYAEQQNLHFDLSQVRQLISAGAPLPAELRSRFAARFGKRIDDYYALTEVRPVFGQYWNDLGTPPPGAIGRASPGADIRFVDADKRELERGQQGEMLVRAPATFKRYHKDEELTRRSLQGGYLLTGDLGFCDADGYFYLTGRLKDIIIRGGAKIAPVEVENIIATHPAAQAVAVIGVPDAKFGELVVAYVMPRANTQLTETDLVAFCIGKLADFKLPTSFVILEELPLGVTGKVDKRALKARWQEDHP